MINKIRILFFIFFGVFGTQLISAQKVALKSNVLMLGALTPNLSCEVVTGEHTSIDTSVFGHYKPYGINSRLIGIQPEFRFWFNGRPMIREYLGIAALGVTYDITWKDDIFKGDAIGIGGTFGYCISLKERFNIEFYGGFGAVYFRQKQYYVDDNRENIQKPNAWGYKLLPIKLGITISYILH